VHDSGDLEILVNNLSADCSCPSSHVNSVFFSVDIGGYKGGARYHVPPPELAPNKFQERLSGASRMQENFSCRALGEPTALPKPSSWWGGWLPLPEEPHPAVASDPNYRRLDHSQHDGLDPPLPVNLLSANIQFYCFHCTSALFV